MTRGGYALRLRFDASLRGPWMRCLSRREPAIAVDAREVDQPGGGDELSSPYVKADVLDMHAWARDALVLALPAQLLCKEDCLGLCAVCGTDLNAAVPDHAHEARARCALGEAVLAASSIQPGPQITRPQEWSRAG